MEDLNRQTRIALGRAINVIEVIRNYHPKMETQTAHLFLELARSSESENGSEGLYMKDLADILGVAQSSASRSVALLSKWLKYDTPGLGWIEAYENPMNRRLKILKLTAKGEKVKQEIARAVGGN